jgi:hypothetical protein
LRGIIPGSLVDAMVKNSHYVARHLTKPWEVGERKLRHFDVAADRLALTSSRNLFTVGDPYPGHVRRSRPPDDPAHRPARLKPGKSDSTSTGKARRTVSWRQRGPAA